MRKAYFGPPGAQIHTRIWGRGDKALLLLPPSPHSSLYFETAAPILAESFEVIAVDYPGFGGSDPVRGASIAAYAKALLPVTADLKSVSLAAFHTGNLVALELGLMQGVDIQNILMIDVPYFDAKTRADLDIKIGQSQGIPDSIDDLAGSFEKNVTARKTELGAERAYDIWAESLRPGAGRHEAFHAAFAFDCEAKFPKLSQPVSLIATQSGLLEPTRKAAQALPEARLTERLDIKSAVFETHAEDIAAAILAALS